MSFDLSLMILFTVFFPPSEHVSISPAAHGFYSRISKSKTGSKRKTQGLRQGLRMTLCIILSRVDLLSSVQIYAVFLPD